MEILLWKVFGKIRKYLNQQKIKFHPKRGVKTKGAFEFPFSLRSASSPDDVIKWKNILTRVAPHGFHYRSDFFVVPNSIIVVVIEIEICVFPTFSRLGLKRRSFYRFPFSRCRGRFLAHTFTSQWISYARFIKQKLRFVFQYVAAADNGKGKRREEEEVKFYYGFCACP